MTACTHLSDLMPATAHGRHAWSREEADHLDRCADCRAEWALVRASVTINIPEAVGVDPAVVARAAHVKARGAQAAASSRRRWIAGGVAAAAAVVLLVQVTTRRQREVMPPATVALELPALDSLSEDELQLVLAAVSGSQLTAAADQESPGLEVLDSLGLEQLLTTLEGT